ncbi:MAG: ATP-binding protein [Leptolyngbyaceae cyanobacterium bins.302]|nr:ATP-binding protein [Leptolyngbyaceae cyanobacterium bins.302]
MSEDSNFEPLSINPDRVCEGISKIGYKPSSALMDIIDNSVTAGATKIYIDLTLKEGVTLATKGGIAKFRIVDNGCGMDKPKIKTALDLGSVVSYPPDSLSKFGLGLKSAGFSLGERIQIVSKVSGNIGDCFYLDREVIRSRGYGLCSNTASNEHEDLLREFESGTIVEISKTIGNQDSAGKIRRELLESLGVVYYYFLTDREKPIQITLRYRDKQEEVLPKDILFWDKAHPSFDPDNYDGKLPCKVLDEELEHPYDSQAKPVKLQICIFPKSEMSRFGGFSDEERDLISSFQVGRKNSGFFIFRNRRLIRWGDNLEFEGKGIVGKDDFGFRARVLLTTEHDELFHVDVSKQDLMVPEEIISTLQNKIRIPRRASNELFEVCDRIMAQPGGAEGEESSRRVENFEEEDFDEVVSPPPPAEKSKRRSRIIQRSQESEVNDAESAPNENQTQSDGGNTNSSPNEPEDFRKIRYTDRMQSLDLWSSGQDINFGTYVRINKLHPFYQLVLSELDSADPTRIAIEGLLFCSGVAENKTLENLSNLSYEDIEKVLTKLRRVFSQTLNSWTNQNQDLYE